MPEPRGFPTCQSFLTSPLDEHRMKLNLSDGFCRQPVLPRPVPKNTLSVSLGSPSDSDDLLLPRMSTSQFWSFPASSTLSNVSLTRYIPFPPTKSHQVWREWQSLLKSGKISKDGDGEEERRRRLEVTTILKGLVKGMAIGPTGMPGGKEAKP